MVRGIGGEWCVVISWINDGVPSEIDKPRETLLSTEAKQYGRSIGQDKQIIQ